VTMCCFEETFWEDKAGCALNWSSLPPNIGCRDGRVKKHRFAKILSRISLASSGTPPSPRYESRRPLACPTWSVVSPGATADFECAGELTRNTSENTTMIPTTIEMFFVDPPFRKNVACKGTVLAERQKSMPYVPHCLPFAAYCRPSRLVPKTHSYGFLVRDNCHTQCSHNL
jgi:hypothetical protein